MRLLCEAVRLVYCQLISHIEIADFESKLENFSDRIESATVEILLKLRQKVKM